MTESNRVERPISTIRPRPPDEKKKNERWCAGGPKGEVVETVRYCSMVPELCAQDSSKSNRGEQERKTGLGREKEKEAR